MYEQVRKDFFNSFVNNPIELPSNQIKFSDEIQDAPWFSFSWLNDPTVMSVLNVLDSIHAVFNGSENLYEKIKNNNQSITFQFILCVKVQIYALTQVRSV